MEFFVYDLKKKIKQETTNLKNAWVNWRTQGIFGPGQRCLLEETTSLVITEPLGCPLVLSTVQHHPSGHVGALHPPGVLVLPPTAAVTHPSAPHATLQLF